MDYKAIVEQLEQGVKDVWQSDSFREYLGTMSKFHNYSIGNILLIMQQKPDATLVAGFNSWRKNFKRNVKKGEKGIYILAPVVKKTELSDGLGNKTEKTAVIGFRTAYVFDVSQTEGEALPEIKIQDLSGDVEGYKGLLRKLEGMAAIPVRYDENCPERGYCTATEIVIREGMSEAQTVKTLIHELAHHLFGHIAGQDRQTAEVQAESTAYVVSQALGIDTSEYSFTYVAAWAKDQDGAILKDTLKSIQKTAQKIIKGVQE